MFFHAQMFPWSFLVWLGFCLFVFLLGDSELKYRVFGLELKIVLLCSGIISLCHHAQTLGRLDITTFSVISLLFVRQLHQP